MVNRKILVIGLDAAPPKLLYEKFKDELEVLGPLVDESARYLMRTSHPPITIPAWMSMVTGKTPGELGLYGFRPLRPGNYLGFYLANYRFIKHPTIWDVLGSRGLKNIVVGVPPTYPPKPIRGYLISDFITPGPESNYTWPPMLKKEIEKLVGEYIFDVVFRSEDRDRVKRELWEMTEKRFKVLRYLAENKKWDFFMFVEIGVDRVQHAFWGFMDPEHHKYVPGNKYENVIRDYYKLIDREVKTLLEKIPKDTIIVVVSDHGAKRMKGAFTVNQWLAQQGYLKLEEEPSKPGVDLKDVKIDWSKTIAWGWGGYYARIFLNVKGREPKGIIEPRDYEHMRDQLAREIRKIRGPNGEQWKTMVYKPEELYPEVNGDAPDLIVYFDDLYWRSAGTLGWPTNYLPENDRGPDDAVHDWHGILAIYDPEGTLDKGFKGEVNAVEVKDLIMKLMETWT